MRYDRDDDMIITGKRHDFRIAYDVGFDDQGQIEAVRFTQITRGGWAQDLTAPVADRAMLHADNAYLLPHAEITSLRLKTNKQSATAIRGYGGPQGVLGIERVMDHIAHDLGLDPALVRRRNYYAAPKSAARAGLANTTPYGMEVRDFLLHEMTDQLLSDCDYAARRAEIAAWNETSPILKRGIAFSPVKFGISFTLTHLNQAGALVHLYQDGSIMMNHGGTEMGQGLFQKLAQVAASRFGVGVDQVKITATDTAKVPNTSATAASSGSDLNGMAVLAACDAIRTRMAEFLGQGAEVRFADGRVMWGDQNISFAEAVAACYQARVGLSATGFYKTPDLSWDRAAGQGRPFFYFAHGAAVSEVVIDRLTGENRILRADILHDVGASLNPALDRGQVEGGYVQGAGWLMTEELVWDDRGHLRTHAPSTYKIPACSDRPAIFNVALVDGENPEATIYRSKAVGEPPFMLGISAFLAVSDAISACGGGYPNLDAPATPERILRAIQGLQP
jgi:xanthine dehydrogenase large subunit